ncbi:hypothetical protein QC764_100150 [Podospora pseudoanserina]|uniref:DUF7918 domain-containing protein n=1 Tax=Podospora pseudoanserina TaxID=2609844 RepID=A0ABR0IKG8_9PEZI|nr:hypothetical protein QC764_100150 [Podospora pseudoanserina]
MHFFCCLFASSCDDIPSHQPRSTENLDAMAILPSIPGLTVTVEVADRPTKEYDDPDADSMQIEMQREEFDHHATPDLPYVVKYIEAKPGAFYHYRVSIQPRRFHYVSDHVGFTVVNDGRETGMTHLTFNDRVEKLGLSLVERTVGSTVSRTRGGSYINRYFCFSALNVVESDQFTTDQVKKQTARAKETGVLKVHLYHMDVSEGYKPQIISGSGPENETTVTMAEKSLKGRAVDCVTSSVVRPRADHPGLYPTDNYHDPKKRPFAVFEFRYRSKEGLIKEGIIPRPTVSGDIKEMSETEVRRKLAELLEKQKFGPDTKPARLKREADRMEVDDWAPDPAFETRYKTRRLSHGQMEIDLTED